MSMATELEALGKLHRDGTLTDEEFAQVKARIVNGGDAAAGVASLLGNLDAGRLAKTGADVGGKVLQIRTAVGVVVMLFGCGLSIFIATQGLPIVLYTFLPMWLVVGSLAIYAPYWFIRQAKQSYVHTAGDPRP